MQSITEKRSKSVPKYLIKEEIDGKPFYYKGFREVLSKKKTFEEIMGSSVLQTILIGLITRYLGKQLPENILIGSNEAGLHLAKNSNLANDIALYDLKDIENPFSLQYFEIPPKTVIEVDVDIEAEEADFWELDFVLLKTQKLLDFGVERVIWITAKKARKIFVAEIGKNWYFTNWNADIPVLGNTILNLENLLKENKIL